MTDCPENLDSQPLNILAFHKTTSKFSFGVTNFSPNRLFGLIEFLLQKGLRIVPLKDLLSSKCDTRNRIAITFDDAYQHIDEVVLRLVDRYEIRPTIFVPIFYMGKKNSWDYSSFFRTESHMTKTSIRQLSKLGIEFGSHGHFHSDLTALSAAALRKDLTDSKAILEEMLAQTVVGISYPFGRYNQAVIRTVKECGYGYGLTMDFPQVTDFDFTRGRLAVYSFDTHLSVLHKLNRGRLYQIERLKAGLTNKLSYGTVLMNRILMRD